MTVVQLCSVNHINIAMFFKLFLILLKISVAFNQLAVLSCDYTILVSKYSCLLTIKNPSEQNNFIKINGKHLGGYGDDNVKRIVGNFQPKLSYIPSRICQKFKNLESMDFTKSNIRKLDRNSIKDCKSLSNLILDLKMTTKIDNHTFSLNDNLRTLEIFKATTLPENIFSKLNNLETLVLIMKSGFTLPDNTFEALKNLKRFEFKRSKIADLKIQWFQSLGNLEILDLSWNKISKLPKDIFSHLKKLQCITLDHNLLQIIKFDSFGVQPNLEVVSLQYNQITAIQSLFIEKSGTKFIAMANNVCSSETSYDNTIERSSLMMGLKLCFENYVKMSGVENNL